MPPPSSKPWPVSYPEAIRVLADSDVAEDVQDACTRLTQSMGLVIQRMGAIAKQLHTIDLQRLSAPLKPRWDGIWKEYTEVLGQYRANAGYISARLKLFCTSVLPVITRNADRQSRRPYEEGMHVLGSFMSISVEHCNQTRSLLDRTMILIREMVAFHTEFSQIVCQQMNSGQKEIQDLSSRTQELESQVRQVCRMNMALGQIGPVFSIFAISRMVAGFGRKPSRSRLCMQTPAFPEESSKIPRVFNDLDMKRNEFAHAQYCAQVRSGQTNLLARVQTTIAPLIADVIHYLEASLTLFCALWLRLQTDCCAIVKWIKEPSLDVPVVLIYQETGKTLYFPLTQTLDAYIMGLDPNAMTQAT